MYSSTKIAQRIEESSREQWSIDGGRTYFTFTPEYHSIADVIAFEDHLKRHQKYIYDSAGLPVGTQNLSEMESKWILNEQVLFLCDASYALTRYCYVLAEDTVIGRFSFRFAQRMLFDIIASLEDLGSSIEILILKARQLGMTTLVELLILIRLVTRSGVNGVIASSDRTKSRLMAKKLFMGYDLLPVWLRPQFTARREGEEGILEFAATNSGVTIQHGNQMSGISRGSTPSTYHLSEVAGFTRPVEQIDASLFKAVHASSNILGFLEGTGEGDQGWWPDKWRYSKSHWPNCRLFPRFFPWACGLELYPNESWLRKYPIPEGWYERRDDATKSHVAKAEAYINNDPLLRKYLCCPHPDFRNREHWWANGRMPIEQQWFWEFGHLEAKGSHAESIWFQEMAGDDIESLQRSTESVFGYEVITHLESNRAPFRLYGLCGQSIEAEHEPPTELIDYGTPDSPEPRIIVTKESQRGNFRWEIIRLLHDEAQVDKYKKLDRSRWQAYINEKLMIFEPPAPGYDYTIGVDTSSGRGRDSTVISVIRVGRDGVPDRQVAEFRSAYVSHVEAFAFVAPIAAYYSNYMADTTRYTHPLISIEQVAAVGDTCQVQLQKLGFTRFPAFFRFDTKSPAKSRATTNRRGWYTFGWSRPILLDGFVHAVRNGWFELNSPWTIDECAHFESSITATGREKKEHEDGEHDDGIFASAIAMQTSHMLDSLTERTAKKFQGPLPDTTLPHIDLRPWKGFRVAMDASGKPKQIADSQGLNNHLMHMEGW